MVSHRAILIFSVVSLVTGVCQRQAAAQSAGDSDLRKEVEQLKNRVQALQIELDGIKTMLREQTARANPVIDIAENPAMGDAGAKLVMIEFSDFQCPYCLEYFKTAYRQVIENYVKTGKIRYVFADFPGEKIHPHALRAAEAARCANAQGKFWDLHDQLFTHQRDLGATGIEDAAHAAGVNEPEFSGCLAAGQYAEAVRHAEEATSKLGIQGTPVFVFGTPDPANPGKIKVGRALVGAQPFAVFQQTIDSLLAK